MLEGVELEDSDSSEPELDSSESDEGDGESLSPTEVVNQIGARRQKFKGNRETSEPKPRLCTNQILKKNLGRKDEQEWGER